MVVMTAYTRPSTDVRLDTELPVLPTRLADALRRVTVAVDPPHATVGERKLSADSPRELRRLLSEALYEELHTGHVTARGTLSFRYRDPGFEAELAAAVPHRTTVKQAVVLSPPETYEESTDGTATVLVELDGVRVHVPLERITDGDGDGDGEGHGRGHGEGHGDDGGDGNGGGAGSDPAAPGTPVRLRFTALRPALSPGFFVVDGSRTRTSGGGMLRLYVHLTDWRAAAPVWSAVLRHLEDRGIAYRSKVLSAKALYPRRDALVVYLPGSAAEEATGIAEAIAGMPGLGRQTSLLAEELGPGIARAWEPADPRPAVQGLSFGQHRAAALARALIEHARGEGPLPALFTTAFTDAGIDPARPARNLPA